MSNINEIPKHVGAEYLSGLKVGDLVTTKEADYTQEKNSFETKPLPAGSVGRVKKIFDFGARAEKHGRVKRTGTPRSTNDARFLINIKVEGHPITMFYAEELRKVKV
jgi:hypothetical protein